MIKHVSTFFIIFFCLFLSLNLKGETNTSLQNFPIDSHVRAELIQEDGHIHPGRPFWVALQISVEEGWHVYWKNPGDAGVPLQVEWKLPPGFEAAPLQWPFPEKFTMDGMVGYGYHTEVVLLAQITPPKQVNSSTGLKIEASLDWLVCNSMNCQPGSASAELPLQVSASEPQVRSEFRQLFQQARAKIPQSHVEVKTIRKDGLVQLEVTSDDQEISQNNSIEKVYFFPEEKDVIDSSKEPTMSKPDQNRYLVNLKGSDEIGAQSKILKGVLVLHEQNGKTESYKAFDIESPIQDENDGNLLGFLENPRAKRSSIGSEKEDFNSHSFEFEGGMGLALLFAFIGGMILNLMPCVLPVLSFKVMSFVKMAGQSRSLTLKHGLVFSLGVLFSFWVLASVMFTLRAYGNAVGWGFQLQEPLFVVLLASFLFIFALNLFGVFELGLFLASWAGQTQADKQEHSSGYSGSFLSGILATAVATPCTGPFLGSTVGFAVTLPIYQSLLIFTFLAFGMCFPYLLLAGFPSLLRFMPKPGPWMETFKQLMGFVLLATVLWLLWVFSAQTDAFALICLLAGFLCFSIAAWIYGRGSTPLISRAKRVLAYTSVVLLAVLGWQAIVFPRAGWYEQDTGSKGKGVWQGWEEFSPERVAQLRKEGKPILIDFTAKWCLVCQANHMILASNEVEKKLEEAGVVKLVADWTKNDPVITKELSKFGRSSVPLYLFYGDDQEKDPVILPQVLTTDIILEHMKDALSTTEVANK